MMSKRTGGQRPSKHSQGRVVVLLLAFNPSTLERGKQTFEFVVSLIYIVCTRPVRSRETLSGKQKNKPEPLFATAIY